MNAPDSNRQLTISRLLPAPITQVWEAWTDPNHVKNWWGPNGFTNEIHKMDVVVDGEWLLTMLGPDGKRYPNKSIYREIVPMKRIVFEHFNPGYIATITFEPKGNETFIQWTMLFETIELYETVVKTFRADEGLKQNGEKLEDYLKRM